MVVVVEVAEVLTEVVVVVVTEVGEVGIEVVVVVVIVIKGVEVVVSWWWRSR